MSRDSGIGRQLPAIDRLIHEPARYNIMALLYVISRADFLFLQNQTNLTAGNLSAHVSKLDMGGYLKVEKEFLGKKPKTFLSLTESGREAFEDYRRSMKEVLADLPAVKDGDPTSSTE